MSANNEKNSSRAISIREYGLDFENFIIYLHGAEENPPENNSDPGIEFRIANRFIKNLDILSGIDSIKPITISMKLSGGILEEGMAIYDAIRITPNPISILCYSGAESMSSIVFQAANKRIMTPNSFFMFHFGTAEVSGGIPQLHSDIRYYKNSNEQMLKIYIDSLKQSSGQASKWSKKKIKEWLVNEMHKKENVYLSAKEAVKIGFADEVFVNWDSITEYTEEQLNRK